VKLSAFHCGGERADWAALDAFDPRVGTKVVIPYFFYLVQHPDGNILFDSGGHPDLAENPRARLGPAADAFEVLMSAEDLIEHKLAAVGLSVMDITHVAHSHLHYDHCGGIEVLKHADFLIQQSELSFAYSPPVYQRNLFVRADFDHPVHWTELKGETDVFGDGRVVLFPTPGHTPGHQSMLVRLDHRAVILVGDAAYLPEKMRARALPPVVWEPDMMVTSWERIEDVQRAHDAVLLFSHDIDYERTTRLAPGAWYE
jgi:glyoxylase-like metal-dependent hydrolase (beta-lactamase superfamily II)